MEKKDVKKPRFQAVHEEKEAEGEAGCVMYRLQNCGLVIAK